MAHAHAVFRGVFGAIVILWIMAVVCGLVGCQTTTQPMAKEKEVKPFKAIPSLQASWVRYQRICKEGANRQPPALVAEAEKLDPSSFKTNDWTFVRQYPWLTRELSLEDKAFLLLESKERAEYQRISAVLDGVRREP